jgi:hypothetical protein
MACFCGYNHWVSAHDYDIAKPVLGHNVVRLAGCRSTQQTIMALPNNSTAYCIPVRDEYHFRR